MIKAAIVLLAAHLLLPLLRHRSAAQRHALWTASLVVATSLPLLAWLLPSWQPLWAQRAAATWPAAFGVGSTAMTAGDIVVRATGVESSQSPALAILPLLWIAGSLFSLGVLAVQAIRLRGLVSAAGPAGPREMGIAREIASRLRLNPPRLTCSEGVDIPLAWGVRAPRVLLPGAARHWSDERVWAVCAHEMAHISRGDWLAHLFAEIACRIYWFNPLFWMARNRLSRESEQAADDVVLGLGASGADYASHLIGIVRAARRDHALSPTVAMARCNGLERRVAALLSGMVNRARVSRGWAVAVIVGALMVGVPLGSLSARTPFSIEIRTSNLPPIDDSAARELAAGDSEPVQTIRMLNARTGDVAPSVAEYTTPPLYSDEARRAAIEGVVIVATHIDADGRVRTSEVKRALGFGLDQNAMVALRQWKFRPGTHDGVAVPMDVEIEIAFTLRNDSINMQIANDMVSLVGPGVTPPQAVHVVPPQRANTAGSVVLDVVLLENGTPRIVRILRSAGREADDSAVRTFEQWRFSPALKDGQPIKVRMNAEVRFHG